jgi:16S rRNA (adenine1518-N6/adenine1519-N6)-dimethyltransferase
MVVLHWTLPRKLGQHFLVRDAILERLAAAACGEHVARVIEIGPGRGALTRHLLPRCDELHAVELDATLADYLKTKFAGEPKLHVHQTDVLAADLSQWGAAVVAGNLPYYIASPILEKYLSLDARFPMAVFLVQWEVAERLLAQPGTRAYGFLTVVTRLVCEAELVCKVPASAFLPPPKVDSGALRFRRREQAVPGLKELREFVSRCFAQKRKTLRNNLRSFYGAAIDDLPEAGLRAEQLSLAQFVELHAKLAPQGDSNRC